MHIEILALELLGIAIDVEAHSEQHCAGIALQRRQRRRGILSQ